MDSFEHSPLRGLVCPSFRVHCLSFDDRVYDFVKINTPPYFQDGKFGYYIYRTEHHLSPLYWCNNKEPGNESFCGACKFEGIGTTYYFCKKCELSYHKECVESLPLIKSPYHLKHHIQLVYDCYLNGKMCCYCDASGSRYKKIRLYYYCLTCKFCWHPVCATRPPFLNYPKRHEHDLSFFPREADLTCDVCGVVDRKLLIYVCLQCDFVVHKNCIYLPFVIRISRHDHRLSFTYSLPSILSCGVCRQNVGCNYGNYSCMKECSYVVHSKCATRKDVWDGKELKEEPEEENENLVCFEVMGDGVIQHSSHSHPMKFEKKTVNTVYDEEKLCQACVLPFYGGGVYKCIKSKCDFELHEACANLPRTKQHMTHPYPLILQVSDTKTSFYCGYCHRFSHSFRYVCTKGGQSVSIDMRCAAISEPLDHQCHPHLLFLSNELGKSGQCSICGKETFQTLNCIECGFFLCFYCATLPYKVRYEHDEHFLTLSCNENASLNWCEVCERTLGLNQWLYTCHECGTAFHIPCLRGKCAPYVKPAQNLLLRDLKLNLIPSSRLTRPICDFCGWRCRDNLMFEIYDYDRGKKRYCYRHMEDRAGSFARNRCW